MNGPHRAQGSGRGLAPALAIAVGLLLEGCSAAILAAGVSGVDPSAEVKVGMARDEVLRRLGAPVTSEVTPGQGTVDTHEYNLPVPGEGVSAGSWPSFSLGAALYTYGFSEAVLIPFAIGRFIHRHATVPKYRAKVVYDADDRVTTIEPGLPMRDRPPP